MSGFSVSSSSSSSFSSFSSSSSSSSSSLDKDFKKQQKLPCPPDLCSKLPNPSTPWRINQSVFEQLRQPVSSSPYRKITLTSADPEWNFVHHYFNHERPENRSIGAIHCLHNGTLTRQFEACIPAVEIQAQSSIFAPGWEKEKEAHLRAKVIQRWRAFTKLFSSFFIVNAHGQKETFPRAKLLPLWHGTTQGKCDSIAQTGFASFGKHTLLQGKADSSSTDVGYFGNGIYFTNSAKYAAEIYSNGHLILAWVTMREPFPVVADRLYPAKPQDMTLLEGQSAYQNYNAHYIPVISVDPKNKKCAIYYPCTAQQEPDCDELVIFQSDHALPRFWIELAVDLPKTPTSPPIALSSLLDKIYELLENPSVQEHTELAQFLEGHSQVLIALNLTASLSPHYLTLYASVPHLLNQTGEVNILAATALLQSTPSFSSSTGDVITSPPLKGPSVPFNPLEDSLSSIKAKKKKENKSVPFDPLKETFFPKLGKKQSTPSSSSSAGDIITPSPLKGPSVPFNLLEDSLSSIKAKKKKENNHDPVSLAPSSLSPPKIPAVPLLAFGKVAWAEYFGDIGEEPPLPSDINTILSSPCLAFGEKVENTHLLTLVPATVNGEKLTLQSLGKLVQNPRKGGHPTKYFSNPKGNEEACVEENTWVLLTRNVLPGSGNQSYTTQVKLVRELAKKANVSYAVPRLIDVATSLFMHYVRSGERLYGDNPWTRTRCQENFNSYPMTIGSFDSDGLRVDYSSIDDRGVGIGALWKFKEKKENKHDPVSLAPSSLSSSKTPAVSALAFDKAAWAKYFGDIGEEPPLPSDVDAILSSPCPVWSSQRVRETHILTLIPATVNGKKLTLQSLGELVQNPRKGEGRQVTKYSEWDPAGNAEACVEKNTWVLLTRNVLPESRNQPYLTQESLVEELAKKAKVSYTMPGPIEVATSLFMHYVRSGERLYGNSPLTFTICQVKGPCPLIIGGFDPNGLCASNNKYLFTELNFIGIGAVRKL